MSDVIRLATRNDSSSSVRMWQSAAITDAGAGLRTADFAAWLEGRRRAHHLQVRRIPFADLDGWAFEEATGNLRHRSGRFFTVEGLHVVRGGPPVGPYQAAEWEQPIIVQPEVGILGILAKEIDGVLHLLMQAKMEPGNPNLVQLSPTVQATYSNYTGVHRGAPVKYLDYFVRPGRGRVIADVLQSEHGSWFLQKSNRNMIVEAYDDVPVEEDFCWLTLGQIAELMRRDYVVNMDSRTVLACCPADYDEAGALYSDTEVLSWFTAERARHDLRAWRMPLDDVADWVRDEHRIAHTANRYFRVVAVAVEGSSREVASWTQPLFEPVGLGLVAFVVRSFAGVPHLLVHARVEGGFLDTVELGATVQCTPRNSAHLDSADRPPFLDLVLNAAPHQIRYLALHSEEGGRFMHANNRYVIVEADEDSAPAVPPPGFLWVTPGQLSFLLRHGRYVNVQARTLLAILNARAVQL
uniref:DacS5 n=1 Tax=Dactylosporangium sp. SC14051 TaxID=1239282 RepID=K4I6C4_9ACTN|nr:DacS5 [Dactylosporangium sp. SC14051]